MKAQELRIGNYFFYKEVLVRIESILRTNECSLSCSDYRYDSAIVSISDIKQIPLTDEILKDWCGAKDLNGMEELNEHYHFKLGQSSSLYVCTAKGYANEGMAIYLIHGISYSSFPCKYLHELQNLYFALTGEDLEIKFKTK